MRSSGDLVAQQAPTRRSVLAAAAMALGGLASPFPLAGAAASGSRPARFPSARQELLAYQRIVGSTRPGVAWWWHFGEISLCVPRRGIIPVARVQTIAFSRTEWPSADRCRTHFTEVGCLLDLDADELVSRWRNPLTGAVAQAATGPLPGTGFVEGPGILELSIAGDRLVGNSEIDRAAIQPLGLQWEVTGDHLTCTSIQESAGMVIVQCNHAGAGALRESGVASLEATKHYTMVRAASAVAEWARVDDTEAVMLVRGYARKAGEFSMVDPAMYNRLRALHPAIVRPVPDRG